MSILNLDKLNKERKNKYDKYQLFNSILKKCHTKIKQYNSTMGKTDCFYTPPKFILGMPPFDYAELVTYLMTELRNNGLKVKWYPAMDGIYISWNLKDQNRTKYNYYQHRHALPPNNKEQPMIELKTNSKSKKKKDQEKPEKTEIALLKYEYEPGVIDYLPVNRRKI